MQTLPKGEIDSHLLNDAIEMNLNKDTKMAFKHTDTENVLTLHADKNLSVQQNHDVIEM